MKLDEGKLLDAMAMAGAKRPFDECSRDIQDELRAEARAFCVELARQADANERGLLGCRYVYADELRAAFLPPKREPDVEAAVRVLAELRKVDSEFKSAVNRAERRQELMDALLRALGEDA